MENIAFIIFLLTLGYSLKFLKFPENFAQSLNLFIIYISLPATILLQVPKIKLDSSVVLPLMTPWILLIFTASIVLFFGKRLDKNTKAALLLLLPLGNTSFFGFPMLETLLGREALAYGVIYDQLGSFLILATYGAFVIAFYQGKEVNARAIMLKIATFPPFVFLILAIFTGRLSTTVEHYLSILSSTLTPMAIISVGFGISLKLSEQKKILALALTYKLLVVPLLLLVLFRIFGFGGLDVKVSMLESVMPSMITAGALAIHAGFAPKLSSEIVGYGLIISLLTVPLVAWLM